MPLPALLLRAAAAAGTALANRAADAGLGAVRYTSGLAITGLSGAVGNAVTREIGYWVDAAVTNHIPDPSQVMQLFWADQVDTATVREIMGWHGIPARGLVDGPLPGEGLNVTTWRKLLRLSRPRFDVGTAVDLYHQRVLTYTEARDLITLSGFSHPDQHRVLLRNRGWYAVDVAERLWRGRLIGDGEYRAALDRAGIGEAAAQDQLLRLDTPIPLDTVIAQVRLGLTRDENAILRAEQGEVLTDQEAGRQFQLAGYGRQADRDALVQLNDGFGAAAALGMFYRGLLTPEQLRGELAADGIVAPTRQNQWLAGAQPIPGPADLIGLVVREAWDDQAAARFGYDEEFPAIFAYWMRQVGADWSARPREGPGAQGVPLTWPQAHWRAHWRPMEPTQAYQCFHALTPERVAELLPRVPGLREFTWTDLATALKIADYPAPVRAWLAAISYTIPDIRQARQVYQERIRGADWYREQLRRRGHSPADSQALVELEDRKQANKLGHAVAALVTRSQSSALQSALAAYRLGALSRADALARLQDAGANLLDAQGVLDAAAVEENLQTVREGLTRLRRSYLAGEYAPGEVAAPLQVMGLTAEGVQRHLTRWNLARSQSRRMVSTAQIVRWAGLGRLTIPVATTRLHNLGWTDPDVLLLLSDAAARLKDASAKEAKAQDMARTKRQRELEKVQKQAKALAAHAQAQLRRETPLATLKHWVCQAIVSPEWAGERLSAMGYPDGAVADYLRSWATDNEASKKCSPPLEPAAETVGLASQPLASPPASGTIPGATAAEKVVGGTVHVGEQRPAETQP